MNYEKIKNTDEMQSRPITILNDAQKIKDTNFFDHPMAKAGVFYLSCNAGALRLLVPDLKASWIDEMKTGNRVEIEIEPNILENMVGIIQGDIAGRDLYKIFFEDDTGQPFCVQMGSDQCDRMLGKTSRCNFFVYTREGQQLSFKCKILAPEIKINLV